MHSSVDAIYFSEEGKHVHDLSSSTYVQNAEKLSALTWSICAALDRSEMPSLSDVIHLSKEDKQKPVSPQAPTQDGDGL